MIYQTKYSLDAYNFFESDYCKINTDETKIPIDYYTKEIKFIVNSNVNVLSIAFYSILDPNTIITTITINIANDYNYKVNIELDQLVQVYTYP
jgi:hypothetical protein